jgi:2-dehydropantoate 2-reductase
MRLLVVGAGSTGGYLGARLLQAGRDVSFLVRKQRADQLSAAGLRIKSPHGDAVLRPKVLTADTIAEHYDVILIALKGFQLPAAIDDIEPAVGSETMIMPVLNGMGHMQLLLDRFDQNNLIGCALKIATVLDDDGSVVQLMPLQDFAYGELNGGATKRIHALDEFMRAANIGARLSHEIDREMWEKWILLSSLGAITCLMRGTIGEIEASPGGKAFATNLIDEIVKIVRAVGSAPSETFLKQAYEQLTAKGSSLASSMFRDLQRRRPIEVENIVGDLVRHGEKVGIDAPLLSAAYSHLCVYQRSAVKVG